MTGRDANADLLRGVEKIPVSVLTGFLGSGKTTLLNRMLANPALSGTVVLINEFGEIGLDHLMVEKIDEQIVLLSSGCLCCTVRGDLVDSMRDLFARRINGTIPSFRRVVIETTGLADPVPIVHTLLSDPTLSERFSIAGVATTVDACHAISQLSSHPESVKQVALADRLIVTKLDRPEALSFATVAERVRPLNPEADIMDARDIAERPLDVLAAAPFNIAAKSVEARSWIEAEDRRQAHRGHGHGHHHHDVNRHDDRICSLSIERAAPLDAGRFSEWLQGILDKHGENLLRVKGIMNFAGETLPVAIHGVQHIFYPPRYLEAWQGQPRSRLVFIVRDIRPADIRSAFNDAFAPAAA